MSKRLSFGVGAKYPKLADRDTGGEKIHPCYAETPSYLLPLVGHCLSDSSLSWPLPLPDTPGWAREERTLRDALRCSATGEGGPGAGICLLFQPLINRAA